MGVRLSRLKEYQIVGRTIRIEDGRYLVIEELIGWGLHWIGVKLRTGSDKVYGFRYGGFKRLIESGAWELV